jgi:2-polyprenyl-6-methoxyphenol hydroxylase-like FAD-dependent oxidoreductase
MKVVICGAGIAGLALANRMSALDNEIVVLERSAGPRPQGYMIDFFGPGYGAVDAMGLLPAIRGVAYHVREVSFLDEYGRRRAGIQPCRLAVRAAVQGRACLTDTTDRQMGFYALRDGRVAAFSVRRTPDRAWPDDIRETLRAVYGGLDWIVPTALDCCPPSSEVFYDQVGQIVVPRWSSGRVVLIGDACYAVSLLAGQGASLAVAGAYILAEQLAATQPISRALARYEQLWRPIAEEKQKVGRAGGRWFLPKSDLELWVRRASLRMAGLPLVNRAIAKVLAGKANGVIAKQPVGLS